MDIRIVNSSSKSAWYKDKIGETYAVEKEFDHANFDTGKYEKCYWVSRDGKWIGIVKVSDTEVV